MRPSNLLFTFHLADDIVCGFEPAGFKNVSGVVTLAVWLYGMLALGVTAIFSVLSARGLWSLRRGEPR
jgi:hypothetical protein